MKHLPLAIAAALLAAAMPATAKNLAINSQDYEVDTLVFKHPVGPGVTYAYYRLPHRPLDIFVLETDLTNPYITMEVVNGNNTAVGGERPTSMYARYDAPGHDAVAAHNGDFYTTANGEAGISRMGLYGAGECIFNATGQPLLVIDGQNVPRCGHVNFAGTITANGATRRLHTVNQLRLEWEPATQADQLSLFTPAFGPKMNAANSGGRLAYLTPVAGSATFPANVDLRFTVDRVVENPGQADVPADGAVLFGLGTSADFLATLPAGAEVTVMLGTSMSEFPEVTTFREAIGGSGHFILRCGELCNNNNPDLHPRTFMGISQDRTRLYSVVVDGRTPASAGIDLDDEGRVLQWLGAWEGINLDGGGSSSMVVYGSQQNHPSDGVERAVGNGVVFYSTAPVDDDIASIGFEPRAYRVPITANFRPAIFGYNKYGLLKSRQLQGVTLTCDPQIGHISPYGEFVASATEQTGYIYAEYQGIRTSQLVATINSPLTLDFDCYTVDSHGLYPIHLSAPVGRFTYSVDPATPSWTVADPSVCSVTDGRITGLTNGTTTLTGTSPNFNGTITVLSETSATGREPFERDFQGWTVKQTGGTGATLSALQGGFKVDYTGNGTARNANITFTGSARWNSFGLPSALEIDINPGEATVTQITLQYTDHHGDHGTLYFYDGEALPARETSSLSFDFNTLFDTSDNTRYPVTFSALKLGLGVSAKGKEFTIEVPRMEYVYPYTGSGVEAPQAAALPGLRTMGRTLILDMDCGPVTVYTPDGRTVCFGSESTIVLPSAGLYIVHTRAGAAKVAVR